MIYGAAHDEDWLWSFTLNEAQAFDSRRTIVYQFGYWNIDEDIPSMYEYGVILSLENVPLDLQPSKGVGPWPLQR